MVKNDAPRWWTFRPSQNLSGSVYRCPFCDTAVLATSEHLLVMPEGDASRRRHAHTDCVRAERQAGRFPTADEVTPDPTPTRGWWSRLFHPTP